MSDNKMSSQKVLSGLIWKFGERITAQLVSLIVSIVLARLLTPKDYGAVALIMVFITIANVFVSNGFGNALIQKKDADNIDFSSVFFINIMMSVLLYFILFVIAPFVAKFYGISELTLVLRVLAIRIPIAAINSIQQAYVSRNMLFRRFFLSTLLGTVISGVVGIVMAYHGFGAWSLVAQYLTNTCVDTIVLWLTVRWRPIAVCSWKRAKGLIQYGYKLLLSGLLDTGYTQLRTLIIGKLYSSADLAYYHQGDKYPSILTININSSIGSVLFPALSQVQDDKTRIKQMTRRAVQVSSFVMWPIMIGFTIIAKPFVILVLTEKWLPCVPFIQIFCFSYGLWPIHTSNLQAINAMGKSEIFLKMEVIKKIIGVLALIISVRYGTLAIAISLIVTGVISTFINSYPNVSLIEYRFKEQLSDIIPAFLTAILMAIIIYPFAFLIQSQLLLMIMQIIFGAIVYILLSTLLRLEGFSYIIHFLHRSRTN